MALNYFCVYEFHVVFHCLQSGGVWGSISVCCVVFVKYVFFSCFLVDVVVVQAGVVCVQGVVLSVLSCHIGGVKISSWSLKKAKINSSVAKFLKATASNDVYKQMLASFR